MEQEINSNLLKIWMDTLDAGCLLTLGKKKTVVIRVPEVILKHIENTKYKWNYLLTTNQILTMMIEKQWVQELKSEVSSYEWSNENVQAAKRS